MKILAPLLCTLAFVSCAGTSRDFEEEKPGVATPQEKQSEEPAKPKKLPIDQSLITGVEVERVFELRESGMIYLIDTRPPIFYHSGHIDGAVSLPLKKFDSAYSDKESDIQSALTAGKVIVIYCANEKCPDSYSMAERFAQKGIRTSVFKGGWRLWQQTGLE